MKEPINQWLLSVLTDAEADLAGAERAMQRQAPGFACKSLAGLRAAIAQLSGHDEAAAIRADLRINEMKSDGTLDRMALERALAEQVKWEAA